MGTRRGVKTHPDGRMAFIQGYLLGLRTKLRPNCNSLSEATDLIVDAVEGITELLRMIEADIPRQEGDPRDDQLMEKIYPAG